MSIVRFPTNNNILTNQLSLSKKLALRKKQANTTISAEYLTISRMNKTFKTFGICGEIRGWNSM